jgi:hypothetical protein
MQSGWNTWSNGTSELLVRVPTPLRSPLSVYLAEFWSFARLRPITKAVPTCPWDPGSPSPPHLCQLRCVSTDTDGRNPITWWRVRSWADGIMTIGLSSRRPDDDVIGCIRERRAT